MVYEGPPVVAKVKKELAELLTKDGFKKYIRSCWQIHEMISTIYFFAISEEMVILILYDWRITSSFTNALSFGKNGKIALRISYGIDF
ncbi:hypothetical protein NQ317_019774, partial [Molorchus minor]